MFATRLPNQDPIGGRLTTSRHWWRMVTIALAVVVTAGTVALLWMPGKSTEPSYRTTGAYKALQWWHASRAHPFESIPDAGIVQAKAYSQRYLKNSLAKHGQYAIPSPWEEIGPHNIGGRTLAISLNPQNPSTIYAGSASGGLWRSYSGGKGIDAWEQVPIGFPVLAVSAIAIEPTDSNLMYVGTGEVYSYQSAGTGAAYRSTRGTYGLGILKTTDGGQSWSKSLDWSENQKRAVQAIKINPYNSSSAWAATSEGVYRTVNAGATWQQVHSVVMATDLLISPLDTNIVIAICGNFSSFGHGLYRTIDNGSSWTKISSGIPSTYAGKGLLSMSASNPEIIYGSIGNGFFVGSSANATWLIKSTDSGASWSTVATTDYSLWQGWFAHDVAVNPLNPQSVTTIGIDVWQSHDGGSTVIQKSDYTQSFSGPLAPGAPEGTSVYSHADHHDVLYHPTDTNLIYLANDGGIFRSTDGGQSFEGCNGGYQTTQFYGGFSSSLNDSILSIGGLQDNSTCIYRGTKTWDKFLIGGDGGWAAIDPLNDNVMYGSAQVLFLAKSTDRGLTWNGLTVPASSGPTAFIAPYVVAYDNPQVLYGGRDVVYKSTDGGTSWSATNNGAPLDLNGVLVMDISRQSSNVVYAATVPFSNQVGVFRTTDGGTTWINITGPLPNRFPGDIGVDPNDDSIVYIAFGGFAASHLFKSTDRGDTWADIGQSLPDIPTSAVVVDPAFPDHIYVGNDLGVYVSTDGGANWSEFQSGLPDAVIAIDLSISPQNRKLRVATHGNGAYQRDLVGILIPGTVPSDDEELLVELDQNYPNPFNPVTTIRYRLVEPAVVTLKIFNVLGQEVVQLVHGLATSKGEHEIRWDGRNRLGNQVAAGTYIYRLTAGKTVKSRRLLFLK